jgi:hypothetical protein
MESIRKISHIKNNTLVLHGLDALNDRAVEVIIHPIEPAKHNPKPDAVDRFCGIFQESGSLTKSLLEERHKDVEIEEKKIAR